METWGGHRVGLELVRVAAQRPPLPPQRAWGGRAGPGAGGRLGPRNIWPAGGRGLRSLPVLLESVSWEGETHFLSFPA